MKSIEINQKFNNTEIFEIVVWSIYILGSLCLTSGGPIWYVAPLMAMFAYLLVSSMLHSEFCNSMLRDTKVICLVIYVAVLAIEGLPVGGLVYIGKQVVHSFHMYMPMIMFIYFKSSKRRNMLKKIVKISYYFIIFFCVYNIIFYTLFPAAARRARDYDTLIGGGYGLACGLAVLITLIIAMYIKGYLNKKHFSVWFPLVLMILTIVKTESTITLISCLIGIICIFYFHHKHQKTFYIKVLALPLVLSLILLLLPFFGDLLIAFTEEQMQESRLYTRIYYLGTFLSHGTNNTYAEYFINRFSLPFQTFKTFLSSPIYGVAYKFGSGFLHPRGFGVGNHGEWTDALASYGILGGIPFIAMYVMQIKEVLHELKSKRIKISRAWVFVVVLLGIFNPLRSFHFNFFFFFFIPSVVLLIKNSDEKNRG